MNIENLIVSKEYKNYKELCKVLNVPIKSGDAKQNQLKWFKEYFSFHKNGHKIIIDEIFDKEMMPMKDNRGGVYNTIDCPNFKVEGNDWYSIGVYKITLNNDIYI